MTEKYPLSTAMKSFVEQSMSFFPLTVIKQGIEAQRVAYNAMTSHFATPRPESLIVEDESLDGIKVRYYRPLETSTRLRILFAHGGGWYLGGLESHDNFCANLAYDCGITLISVAYGLAPEAPYPAGIDDITQVYQSLLKIDTSPILLMGDSAGGNLMATLSHQCRSVNLPPAYGQCLIYPALSAVGSLPSHTEMADAPLLDLDSLHFCWDLYQGLAEKWNNDSEQGVNDEQGQEPKLKEVLPPLQAKSFNGLPPTMLFAAEYDPLLDDAHSYQQVLKQAGVPVQLTMIEGLVHGGLHGFQLTEEGRQLYRAVCAYVKEKMLEVT